ncbi:uncharacterized protein LOC114872499 [Osmia bicornis bicornis]|uniref:uncharacterized protein LOC114872499 n=1 Tax=Osmia bicornis bicornis TaxID=1437191 RepID=UPI001EAF648B|nr:uncharacterized protein LOC114872499 [Osmia bicornis bicornis]
MFIVTAVLMIYIVFMIKKEDVKNIMEKVKYDWDTVKTIHEQNLLKKYAKIGKHYINTFSRKIITIVQFVTYSCLAVTWLTPFTNELLDLVKPLNESRSRKFPILVELFIDQEKFHYPISFIFNLLLLMSCICIIATQYVTIMWYQHVVSLFEIIRCRTNEAFTYVSLSIHVSERTSKMMNILTILTKLIPNFSFGIQRFLDYILSKFRVLYFILVGSSVVVLSICFFFIFQAFMCRTYDNEHLFVTAALCLIVYLFYWNYLIQQVIDSYNNVFIQLYTVDWYNAPLCVQKLILTMMISYSRQHGRTLWYSVQPKREIN